MPQKLQDEEEPCKVKGTEAYIRLHGKDMSHDSIFEFERERNRPERYDRNVAENTLKDIKKIDKVRLDREARHHHAKRMKGKKAQLHREAAKELEQSIHISHVQSSCCSPARSLAHITKDQGPSFSTANRGQSHGGIIEL